MISLVYYYLGCILHHCNAKKVLIYSYDVTECVFLRGDRILKSALIISQHRTVIVNLFRLPPIVKRCAGDEFLSVCLYSRVLLFSNFIYLNYLFTKNRVNFLFNTCSMVRVSISRGSTSGALDEERCQLNGTFE